MTDTLIREMWCVFAVAIVYFVSVGLFCMSSPNIVGTAESYPTIPKLADLKRVLWKSATRSIPDGKSAALVSIIRQTTLFSAGPIAAWLSLGYLVQVR